MTRRIIVIVAIFLGGLALLAPLRGWHARDRAHRAEAATAALAADDPRERLAAATELLKLNPMDGGVRLDLAQALLENGRFAEVPAVLVPMDDRLSPHYPRARLLEAESYLAEASLLAERAGQNTLRMDSTVAADRLVERFEEYLRRSGEALAELSDAEHLGAELAVYRARAAAVRAAMIRTRLRAVAANAAFYGPMPFGTNEAGQQAALDVARLKDELALTRAEVWAAAEKAIELDPGNGAARALLFQLYLELGDLGKARAIAREMVGLPRLDGEYAGQVADALLQMEARHAQYVTEEDVSLARHLIQHPALSRPRHLARRLAEMALALRDRDERARELGEMMLAEYPGHPRVMIMRALVDAAEGKPDQAAADLQQFIKRHDSADVRFTLGMVLIAGGRQELARQWINDALELDPENISAHLALVDDRAEQSELYISAPHIKAALALNPNHPRVQAFHVKLLLANLDRPALLGLLRGPPNQPDLITAGDLALAVGMVLDEIAWVTREADSRMANDASDKLARLAHAWGAAPAETRLDVAALIIASLEERLSPAPLAEVDDPPLDAWVWRSPRSGAGPDETPPVATPSIWNILNERQFLPSPYHRAAAMLEQGERLWPSDEALGQQRARLDYWLQAFERVPGEPVGSPWESASATGRLVLLARAVRAQDDAAVDAVLAALLESHPWCEPAAMMVIADAVERGEATRAQDVVALVAAKSPPLAYLVSARLDVGRGRPDAALVSLDRMIHGAVNQSPLHRVAADLRVRAHLAMGNVELAVGTLEGLALRVADHAFDARLACADLNMFARQTSTAAATLAIFMGNAQIPSYWLHRVLVRAEAIMQPAHLVELLDSMLPALSERPVVRYYRAAAFRAAGRTMLAAETLHRLAALEPDAPRVLLLRARVATDLKRLDEARVLYDRLLALGGRPAEVAREDITKLGEGDE